MKKEQTNEKKEEKTTKTNIILRVIKKIKPSTLIIAIMLLMFNSYAWFIYATKVSVGFNAHVTSWNIEFETGEGESTTNIIIDLERIYPGMENFEKEVTVHNKGETTATLSYDIESIKILGGIYAVGDDYSSADLENMVKNNYPFKFDVEINDADLVTGVGNGSFKITLEWPFESGDDELDTYWGKKSYEYHALHPTEKSLQIKLRLTATQAGT